MIERIKSSVITFTQLSTPMVIAMLSQSLMSLVDVALVGPLGEDALAAVGVGSNAMLIAFALIAGISSSVQTQVARRVGGNKLATCATPLNHGLMLAFFFALPLSLLLLLLAPWLLKIYTGLPEIHDGAVVYFRIRIMTLAAAALNLSCRGYWNGIRHPHYFLKILLFSHLVNAAMSYLLIYGYLGMPKLGISGAAIGTLISMYLCAFLNLKLLHNLATKHGFIRSWGEWLGFIRLIKMALPDSIQQTFFCLGVMMLYVIVAKLGAREMAITHVITNISLFLILPSIGLGISITTLVSQSLGAGYQENAFQWGKDGLTAAIILLIILSLPLMVTPSFFLSCFLHDQHLLDLAKGPLQLLCIGVILDAGTLVLPQALLGAGANRTVLYIRFFFQWLVLLPFCWLAGSVFDMGLSAILTVQLIQRFMSSLTFIWVWWQRKWINISI